jgi:hypothetical protein
MHGKASSPDCFSRPFDPAAHPPHHNAHPSVLKNLNVLLSTPSRLTNAFDSPQPHFRTIHTIFARPPELRPPLPVEKSATGRKMRRKFCREIR